jgi:heptosyltransferase II
MISDIKRILIIKLGALGDVLRTTCILPGLKQMHKTSHISWLTDPSAKCLLKSNGLIDELLFCREGEAPSSALRSHDV